MFGSKAFQGVGDALGSIGSFIAESRKAEADRKWQAYNNAMVRLQDGQNQNSITTNENMRKERKATQVMQVQMSERATAASAEVSAAATGTTGNSVRAVLFDIGRNAARARQQIEKDDDWQDMQTDQQRLSSAMSAEMNVDLRQIPTPNPTTMMLGIAKGFMRGTQ